VGDESTKPVTRKAHPLGSHSVAATVFKRRVERSGLTDLLGGLGSSDLTTRSRMCSNVVPSVWERVPLACCFICGLCPRAMPTHVCAARRSDMAKFCPTGPGDRTMT
jgi:hypothetical protein